MSNELVGLPRRAPVGRLRKAIVAKHADMVSVAVKEQLEAYDALTKPLNADKDERPRFRSAILLIDQIDAWGVLAYHSRPVRFVPLGISSTVAGGYIAYMLAAHPSFAQIAKGTAICAVCVFALLGFGLIANIARATNYLPVRGVPHVMLGYAYIAVAQQSILLRGGWGQIASDGLRLAVSIGAILFALAAIRHIAVGRLYRTKMRRYPRQELIQTLADVLAYMHHRELDLQRFPPPLTPLDYLEHAAQVTETQLFRTVKLGQDVGTQTWVKDLANRMAGAIRGVKRDILSGSPEKFESARTRVRRMLTCAIQARWSEFEQECDVAIQVNTNKGLRSIVVAVSPLAMLATYILVEHHTSMLPALTGQIRGTAILFSASWLAAHFLSLLSPAAAKQLDNTESIVSIFHSQ